MNALVNAHTQRENDNSHSIRFASDASPEALRSKIGCPQIMSRRQDISGMCYVLLTIVLIKRIVWWLTLDYNGTCLCTMY